MRNWVEHRLQAVVSMLLLKLQLGAFLSHQDSVECPRCEYLTDSLRYATVMEQAPRFQAAGWKRPISRLPFSGEHGGRSKIEMGSIVWRDLRVRPHPYMDGSVKIEKHGTEWWVSYTVYSLLQTDFNLTIKSLTVVEK